MKKILKFLAAACLLAAPITSVQAHTVALGWTVNSPGNVTFYAAHWHGAIAGPSQYLTIDGTQYNFTSIENNLPVRTGLHGALVNSSYFTFNPGVGVGNGTLTALLAADDWLIVTVTGLAPGAHTFNASPNILTSWTLDAGTGDVNFVIPNVPVGGSSVIMLGMALAALLCYSRLKAS